MAYKLVEALELDADLKAVADAIRNKAGHTRSLVFPEGMVGAIHEISTGVPLSFSIVGNPMPSDPEPNTIWVDTDQDISEWILSFEKPTEPIEGTIWIYLGKASPVSFNALQENSIMLNPIHVEQYTSGAWVSRNAKSYINSTWTTWFGYLYQVGDEHLAITGGWAAGDSQSGTNTVTKDSTSMNLKGSAATTARMHVATNAPVDFSPYKALKAKVQVNNRAGDNALVLRLGCGTARNISLASTTSPVARTEVTTTQTGEYTVSCDVSTVTGQYYAIFGIGWYGNVDLQEVWLE